MDNDEHMYDEDEYEPSDATLLFAEEVNKQFKKEFPLKSETEKKKQQAVFRKFAPPMARKLNFDMTLSPVADVAAAKTLRAAAERELKTVKQENGRLKQMLKDKDEKMEQHMQQMECLRERVADLQNQNGEVNKAKNETITECNQAVEIWQTFGKKYYLWFMMASTQLDSVKVYVDSYGKFDNAEEVNQLNAAPRQMQRSLEAMELDDDMALDLGVGSIQAYSGVEFNVRQLKSPEAAREIIRSDVSLANFTMPQSNQTVLDDTNMTMYPEDQTIMTEGCAANRSLIDYEKDEKIQRLLLENSVLKDRLSVSNGRAEKSMIFEEKTRTLELEKNALQKRLDSSFSEIEAMRIGQARELFKIDERVSTETDNSTKQLQLIDRINQLVAKNNQLEKDFAAATSKMTKVMRDSNDCERRNERLEDAFSNERVKSQQLEAERNGLSAKMEESSRKIQELEGRLETMHNELQDALNKTITSANTDGTVVPTPTDAGNTTQIFHMPSNPLQAAHAEFQAAESRKRKMVDAPEGDTTAKHFREERISELEELLDISEREKKVVEDSYNLHKDLASKFRQVCIALTGLQIKLKDADEGICTVQSEYEGGSERQFVFKYFYGTPRIDMLDVNCESTAEMIRKWEPLMKKYIGERNSIPAFLAAMTLQMEQDRDFDETMHERTHTFSVLHED